MFNGRSYLPAHRPAFATAIFCALLLFAARTSSAQIVVLDSFDTQGSGADCSIAADTVTGDVFVYNCFANVVLRYSPDGTLLSTVPRPGETANDVDMQVAPEDLAIRGTPIPRGTLLFINGESGPAEVYAVDPVSGAVLDTLFTGFGSSSIVGGAYHPIRDTFFFVDYSSDEIGEIDPATGETLNTFDVSGTLDVFYGDIEVSPASGNLLIVSSTVDGIHEFTPDGEFLLTIPTPDGVSGFSGIALDCEAGEAWVSSVSGIVTRLGQVPCGSSDGAFTVRDGGICAADEILFSWNPEAGATSYRLDIASAPDPERILDSVVLGNVTEHAFDTASLAEGRRYHARVVADTDGGVIESRFTDGIFVDRTAPRIEPPVAQIEPANSRAIFTLFAEDSAPSVTNRLQIATTPDFASPVVDEDLGESTSFTYEGVAGQTIYARYLAVDCAGNESGFSDAVEITMPLLPDLIAGSVTTPTSGFSGQEVELSWTVSNTGAEGTDAPKWIDAVYINDQPAFDSGEATLLDKVQNLSYLGAGESYTNTQTFTLPRGIQGTHYLFVVTDEDGRQYESDNSNNTGASDGFPVTRSPIADLQVVEIVASDNVFSGDSLDVTWTVENQGTGPTEVDEWFDSIFISEDDVFDFNFTNAADVIRINEPFLGAIEHVGVLEPGEQYTTSLRVKLPDEQIGDRHLFVFTDVDGGKKVPEAGAVYEFNQEFDNWTGEPLGITLTPPPDLVVTAVQPPAAASSGETIDVVWTVENQGPGATRAESWSDVVYYSPTPEFDPETAVVLGSFSHVGALQNDESYTGSGLVTVPDGADGDGYFFVLTDWNGAVFEHTFDENNRAVSTVPAAVTRSPYPDVVVASVGLSPTNLTAGDQVVLRYQTSNSGQVQASAWTDSLFVSTESTWDRAASTPVAALPHTTSLSAGSTRPHSTTVTIPSDLGGTYYFHVLADGADRIFEYPDVDGNVASSGPVVVSAYPPVDLVSSIQQAPASAASGERISVTVRVDNAGTGRTLAARWSDAIYLSTDPVPDADQDVLLLEVEHEGALAGGAGYTLQRDITIPNGLEGDYYLIVFPDVCKVTTATGCQEVTEADGTNNAASELIEIQLSAPSDLRVTNVTVPQNMQASQPVSIDWTVENAAAGPTAGATWFDAVYLSRDPAQDRGDVLLGVRKRAGALAAGASYTGNLEVQVPAFVSGAYYLIVQTDHRNDIYEHLAENNNVAPRTVGVTLPSATDLIVKDVTAPAQATPGEPVTISWTLENAGSHPATGTIREGVFVSEDALWDPSDPLVGVVERSIDLAPGESLQMQGKADFGRSYAVNQSGEITSVLPGVPPGDYYAIVRTDIGGHIRETDTSNNAGVSAGTITTDIPSLAIGETEKNLLSTGDSRYYRVDVPTAGEDIVISLEQTTGGDGSTSLYVRKDTAPTISSFDRSAATPFETDHTIVLTEADAGTYYLLIRANNLPVSDVEFSVSVRALDYSVTSVYPQYGGNVGTVTVRVDGSKFEEGGQVFLEDADGARLQAFETFVQSSTTAIARFNLRDEMLGLRDVVFVTEDGGEAVLADAFDVVPGAGGAQMYVETSAPRAVRSCGGVEVEVTVGNRGTVNANDMFLLFGASGFIVASGPVVPCNDGIDFMDTAPWPLTTTPQPSTFDAPRYDRGGSKSFLPFWMYEVAPGQEQTFTVLIQHFVPEGSVSHFADIVFMPESEFTHSGALDDVESAVGYQILREVTKTLYNDAAAVVAGKRLQDADEAERALKDGVVDIAKSALPVDPFGGSISRGFLIAAVGIVVAVILVKASIVAVPAGLAIAGAAALVGLIYDFGSGLSAAKDNFKAACSAAFGDFIGGGSGKRDVRQRGPTTNTCSDGGTEVKRSVDPNDIVGPGSFGDANWVRATSTLPYTIRFENDPELASAPAQIVDIRHPLDPAVDERTFRLGSLGFANLTFDPPENVSFYRDRLDLSDSLGIFVDVTAGIDVTNREAFWIFQTIDPLTGTQPFNDPFVGLLPVNDSTGAGEGFARYSVRAVEGASTGDKIVAQADIIFDNNAPIETPEIFNTLDADAPSSLAHPQQTRRDSTSVELTWSGSDIGSGLGSFALYVSEDGGDFELYEAAVADSTYLFVGHSGRSYRFFTQARDNVGNSELLKADGPAISISNELAAGEDLPETFELHQNYPNPFNPATTIPFDLPVRSDVEITVYDVLGRRVMHVARETLQAGRHQQRVDLSGYASGVYFYELRVLGPDGARFRDVQNFVLVK